MSGSFEGILSKKPVFGKIKCCLLWCFVEHFCAELKITPTTMRRTSQEPHPVFSFFAIPYSFFLNREIVKISNLMTHTTGHPAGLRFCLYPTRPGSNGRLSPSHRGKSRCTAGRPASYKPNCAGWRTHRHGSRLPSRTSGSRIVHYNIFPFFRQN